MKVTERKVFTLGKDTIVVEIQDTRQGFCWNMSVNGVQSYTTSNFSSILVHEGYGLAPDYWNGVIKEFIPFKIVYAEASQ